MATDAKAAARNGLSHPTDSERDSDAPWEHARLAESARRPEGVLSLCLLATACSCWWGLTMDKRRNIWMAQAKI